MAEKGEFDKVAQPGQPLIVWTCVLLIWVAMRIGASSMPENDVTKPVHVTPALAADQPQPLPPQRDAKAARMVSNVVVPLQPFSTARPGGVPAFDRYGTGWQIPAMPRRETPQPLPWPKAPGNGHSHARVATKPQNLPVAAAVIAPDIVWPLAPPPQQLAARNPVPDKPAGQKSWQLYAYSFWRFAESNPMSLAAGGQYGGSQTGIVATQSLFRLGGRDLSLLARAVASPGTSDGRELAAGLSLKLSRKLGLRVIAEHRLRANSKDASALYIAGSFDNVPMPEKMRLSGFGQGGALRVAGIQDDDITAFLDAGLRAERKLLNKNSMEISLGVGAWAGGQYSGPRSGLGPSDRGDQQNSRRLDIGPTIRLDAKLAGRPLRLHADWRFRVAGNAEPGNGPALTLSTGF